MVITENVTDKSLRGDIMYYEYTSYIFDTPWRRDAFFYFMFWNIIHLINILIENQNLIAKL